MYDHSGAINKIHPSLRTARQGMNPYWTAHKMSNFVIKDADGRGSRVGISLRELCLM